MKHIYIVETRSCACGKLVTRKQRSDSPKTWVCRSCGCRYEVSGRDTSGSKNPAWRGGHRGWQSGKLGRDKDGLSWKVQRKLAWERDHYRCIIPGCTNDLGLKPNVHHKVPYRLSFSHALGNLECLCRSHHKQAEAKIKELWGGKVFGGNRRPSFKCSCGRWLRNGVCSPCERVIKVDRCVSLVRRGLKLDFVARTEGVNWHTLYHWVHYKRPGISRSIAG